MIVVLVIIKSIHRCRGRLWSHLSLAQDQCKRELSTPKATVEKAVRCGKGGLDGRRWITKRLIDQMPSRSENVTSFVTAIIRTVLCWMFAAFLSAYPYMVTTNFASRICTTSYLGQGRRMKTPKTRWAWWLGLPTTRGKLRTWY